MNEEHLNIRWYISWTPFIRIKRLSSSVRSKSTIRECLAGLVTIETRPNQICWNCFHNRVHPISKLLPIWYKSQSKCNWTENRQSKEMKEHCESLCSSILSKQKRRYIRKRKNTDRKYQIYSPCRCNIHIVYLE